MFQIIYVITKENKLLPPYPPHLKNVTAIPYKMQNLFIWLKVMWHSTTLCWNSANLAARRFRNSSVSRIGARYTRSCSTGIQTRLYQPHLRWTWSKTPAFKLPHLHLAPLLGWPRLSFAEIFGRGKPRVPGISCGVVCVILRLAVLVEHWLVRRRQPDRRTNRPTNRQTHNDS